MKAIFATVLASSLSTVAHAECQADTCFSSIKLAPILNKAASIFCLNYVRPTPNLTTTKTLMVTRTAAKTPSTPVTTATVTATATTTSGKVCTTTVSAVLQTFTNYPAPSGAIRKRENDSDLEEEDLTKRQLPVVPNNLVAGCRESGKALTAKISSACTCFLTPTATRTVTSTATIDKGVVTPNAVTIQKTVTNTVIVQTCLSVSTVRQSGAISCGVPISTYTSGTVTCSNTVATPSSNALLRIEGDDSEGTIFEGCIVSGPRSITTSSGNTHLCDGTNNGANLTPGTTPSTQLDAAAALVGFTYDGTYDSQFQDFFITRIGQSRQTATQFWGLLRNEQFTPTGGCQEEVMQTDRTLWAFDAFSKSFFLKISPNYAAVAPGSTVSTTVRDGSSGNAILGASIFGTTSNAAGLATFTAPTQPGCYLYKATAPNAIRSDNFYLSVF